jgi:hypothetical protein
VLGDLNQTTATVLLPVAISLWRVAKPLGQRPGVVLTQILVAAQLLHIPELPRLMHDLSDERRHAQRRVDLIPIHGQIQRRRKNAGLLAGVREELQQLLRKVMGMEFSKAQKSPHKTGFVYEGYLGCSGNCHRT